MKIKLFALICLFAFVPLADAKVINVVVGQGVAAGGGGYATPAYINGDTAYALTTTTGGTFATDNAISVTTGKALLVIATTYRYSNDTTITAVNDTAGNSFTRVVNYNPGSHDYQDVWVCYNTTAAHASDIITATLSEESDAWSITVHQVSGIATTSAYDKYAVGSGDGTSMSTANTATTTQTYEYIMAMFYPFGASGTGTAGANFTERNDQTNIYSEDRVVTSTGEYSGAATWSASGTWFGMVVTFKAAAL